MDPITRVRAQLDEVMRQAEEFTTREDFNPQDAAYVALTESAEALSGSYQALVALQNRRAENDRLGSSLRHSEHDGDERRERQEILSPGEMFIRSDIFRNYGVSGKTPRFTLDDASDILLTRALPSTTAAWAAAIQPPPPRDITAPLAPTPLLDLIPAIPWGSDVVNYVTYSKIAGGATLVPEGTAKPSAEFAPAATSSPMVKIAVYTQATRELLESPGAVRTKIDTLLVNDVRRVAEAEAAAALLAATVPTSGGETLMGAIRNGVATVQVAGFNPNAVLLNPADWAALDIEVFQTGRNNASVNSSFWGLTPVPVPGQAAGTATVGDFSSAMERYVRSAMAVYITDSHANTFIENVFTILAETRELSAVVRPAALCEATATPTPPITLSANKGK